MYTPIFSSVIKIPQEQDHKTKTQTNQLRRNPQFPTDLAELRKAIDPLTRTERRIPKYLMITMWGIKNPKTSNLIYIFSFLRNKSVRSKAIWNRSCSNSVRKDDRFKFECVNMDVEKVGNRLSFKVESRVLFCLGIHRSGWWKDLKYKSDEITRNLIEEKCTATFSLDPNARIPANLRTEPNRERERSDAIQQ